MSDVVVSPHARPLRDWVRLLAGLKVRLLVNGIRHDRQRRVGLPFLLGLIGYGTWWIVGRYRTALTTLGPEAATELTLWAVGLAVVAWATLPVILFPVDEALDPSRFALAPIPRRGLAAGMTVAGLITPTVIVPVGVLLTTVAWMPGIVGTLAGLVAAVMSLLLMVVASQAFATAMSALVRSRRGRDLVVVFIAVLGMGGFALQQVVATVIGELGLEGALLAYPISRWALVVPPTAAQQAALAVTSGDVLGAVVAASAAAAWLVGLAAAWSALVARHLTTPEPSPLARESRLRSLARLPGWASWLVVARKELRTYVRDPRMRMVWTGAVIFLGILAVSTVLGTASISDFRAARWFPLLAPGVVLFVGLPIVLNQIGWERDAASFLFALPIRPVAVLGGKNLATALGLALETAVLTVILAAPFGTWRAALLVPPLALTAIACQLAVGNVVSVVFPLRLPEPGSDMFAQASEQGCLAVGAQVIAFFFIGMLLVPPASAHVLLFLVPRLSEALISGLSLAYGAVVYLAGLGLASAILSRRIPELVSAVQRR